MSRYSKKKWSYIEGWLSIIINTLLFALKYWAGVVSGSIAIIADAWHTLSDSLTSIIVLLGVKISNRPADEKHPFGYGRAELIAAIIIGVILGTVALNFIIESVHKFQNRESAGFGTVAIVVTIVSILLKEGVAQFALRIGKKVNSKILIADGWHHRSDAISSVIILAGIFLNKYFWWMDAALGIAVALMLFYATYEILKDTIESLLGTDIDEQTLNQLKELCNNVAGFDILVHHVHLHTYGDHKEMTYHIVLPARMTLEEAHIVVEALEQEIKDEMGIMATTHLDPSTLPDPYG